MSKLKLMLLFSVTLLFVSCSRNKSLIVVKSKTNTLSKFETFYIEFFLKSSFVNPYDPEDIKVDAIIRTPSGNILTLPSFYKFGSSGNSIWEARFTPMEVGTHSYHIEVVREGQTFKSEEFYLSVKDSDKNGFLRVNKNSLYSFVFDSGKPFRGVGINVGWEGGKGSDYSYEAYLDAFRENEANLFRTLMCPWNLPLEWTRFVKSYENIIVDEFENWNKVFSHSDGLKIEFSKTPFTEDDTNRVLIDSTQNEVIIYQFRDIKRFKIKLFYNKILSKDMIRCYYSSDNVIYKPINVEFSEVWETSSGWYRIFVVYFYELPSQANYLKIEFLKGIKGSPQIGSVEIEYGKEKEVINALGLGKYYQETAERVDELIRLAEERGIYLILSFDYHGIFNSFVDRYVSKTEWRENPYNVANGGPCENQVDFFTDPIARKIYKNKLRYIVARWGYSTSIALWEFFNEIDNIIDRMNVSPQDVVNWHREMANYLKEVDPYKHMITTSVRDKEIIELWEIENIDVIQLHIYGSTEEMREILLRDTKKFKKPVIVGEFAVGDRGPGRDFSFEFYESAFHDGLWEGIFSPTPIVPLSWWWEWFYQKDLFFHLKGASMFVSLMLESGGDFEEIFVDVKDKEVGVIALKSGNEIFLWFKNLGNKDKNSVVIDLPDLDYPLYLLRYYNPWLCEFSEDREVNILNNELRLENISLKIGKDIAVWLRPNI
ncbi:MAG: DUF5060 domain-containing protein [candidate division WOR-3 bacterium]